MVINNDPCYAYLQESNAVTDQKLVMAHVYGHADFFKNNFWFSKTNRKMMDEMANHATRVRRHIERQGQDVGRAVPRCVPLDRAPDRSALDVHDARGRAIGPADDREPFEPEKLPAKDYMDPFINPAKEMDRQKKEYEEKAQGRERQVPRAADARCAAVPAPARAARGLAAGHPGRSSATRRTTTRRRR
jgi:stage V sporulation protein R